MARNKKDAAQAVMAQEVQTTQEAAPAVLTAHDLAVQAIEGYRTALATANNIAEKQEILARITENCKKYNEAKEYNEYETMKAITSDLDDDVDQYNDLQEADVLTALYKQDRPLLAAAVALKYPKVGYKDVSVDEDDPNITERQISWKAAYINTEKLHKKGKDGVGQDKTWILAVQKFNFLLTSRKAYQLGIDPAKIDACYSMKKEAKKLEGLKTDKNATEQVILEDLDKIVKMMIGDEFSAIIQDVRYLEEVYSRKSTKKALQVTCSNHVTMRQHLLDICYRAATGSSYDVDCKLSKKAVEKFEADLQAAAAEAAKEIKG